MKKPSRQGDHHRLRPGRLYGGIYAARAMLKPLLIAGIQPGGQMTITTDVENYPGFADVIQGPWLMEQMRLQAEHVGTEIVHDHIEAVDLKRQPFWLKGDSGTEYTADSADHRHRRAGALARPALGAEIQGLSACRPAPPATASSSAARSDRGRRRQHRRRGGALSHQFRRRRSRSCIAATCLRAEKILQERLFANPKIDVMWNTRARRGAGHRESARRHRRAAEKHAHRRDVHDIPIDGIFIAIGHVPQTEMFKGQLEMNPSGYIITAPRSTATSVPGVFAAGDVTDEVYRQAVTAAGMGCMAALDAERHLAGLDALNEAAE